MKDLIEALIRNKLEDSVTVKGIRVTKSFVDPDFNPTIERVKEAQSK